ncbi:WYL domain-containing protein [Hujiaoplasma nucleasis]|uniref:WYL domain-containing protein n=1 Tax=Hujiaoplasma nucleasis TaxID=2725268 RepID=A0A7L6N7Y1_9MOLU|nr:WYL domain-containing protein [Hujiaoplasma nucleasis]QLY40654.1 WYL domain-containing protein [Hujiaoplasma nucleasis]
MSKISNSLLMLFYLNNKNTYTKIAELSNYLEVSDREIRRYRDDLEMAGFSIENKTGRYGGYLLVNDVVLSMNINHMKHVLTHQSETNSLIKSNYSLMHEIIQSLKNEQIISKHILSHESIEKLMMINLAIKLRYKIKIDYLSNHHTLIQQTIEPYLIKNIRDIDYLFAVHGKILKSYRISNIRYITQTENPYLFDHNIYQRETNENAYGVYRGKEKYLIKFEVVGKMNQFIESVFNNQLMILEQKQNYGLYQVETYDLNEIKYTFLSLGGTFNVISPEIFKQQLLEEVKKIINKL